MKSNQTLFLSLFLILGLSCGRSDERRIRNSLDDDQKFVGLQGLDAQGLELLRKIKFDLNNETRSSKLLVPKAGEFYNYIINLEDSVSKSFIIAGTNKSCRYKYTRMQVEEEVDFELSLHQSKFPIDPVYVGIQSNERKKLCDEQIESLYTKSKFDLKDLKKISREFKTLLKNDFFSLIQKCEDGAILDKFGKCFGIKILELKADASGPREKDLIYHLKAELLVNKTKLALDISFSLGQIYWGVGGVSSFRSNFPIESKRLAMPIIFLEKL